MAQQEAKEIFLFDNEIADLELMCNALRKEGYKVLPTSGYRSGIHRFRLYSGCFDSLVTAVSLPSEASCELAKTLLALHPSLKVIFISSPSEAAVFHLDQILCQGVHFLETPLDLDEFISLVRLIRDPRSWVRTMSAASVA
jgi:DNA-binding NtrC family response regulator